MTSRRLVDAQRGRLATRCQPSPFATRNAPNRFFHQPSSSLVSWFQSIAHTPSWLTRAFPGISRTHVLRRLVESSHGCRGKVNRSTDMFVDGNMGAVTTLNTNLIQVYIQRRCRKRFNVESQKYLKLGQLIGIAGRVDSTMGNNPHVMVSGDKTSL
jgi:hypothetical protein